MELKTITNDLNKLEEKFTLLRGHFDLEQKQNKIQELELAMQEPNFWEDINNANLINSTLTTLKKETKEANEFLNQLQALKELIASLDNATLPIFEQEIITEYNTLKNSFTNLETTTLLSGPHDTLNCFLEIHPGAGGTESCDWASMLLRMYERFCEQNNYTYEVIDYQKGEEAGIKSATILIKGLYAYGYLKGEKGVHRLVRISPFDANSRRHTSFASVSVIPEFKNNIAIEIKDTDLKIDVYHSSGAGGQSVNTSDSAVRITHLPTKIVVTCQVERSQLRNKERAMEMLKSKLYQLELERQEQERKLCLGENQSINFGSQIRSYVLEPYTLVKDNRSNYETAQAKKVLDGDIMPILDSVLRTKQ